MDLSRFAANTFDVVLSMGPLYHLTDPQDRQAALREVHRVLKPGGLFAAVFVTRYAYLRFRLKEHPEQLSQRAPEIETFWQTGVLPAPLKDGSEFIAYLIPPADVRPLVESAGFAVRTMLAVEGP